MDGTPEVYDITTNIWTNLPVPLTQLFPNGCAVPWKDSILVFDNDIIQRFNLTSKTWTIIPVIQPPPYETYSCVVLPTGGVLLTGTRMYYMFSVLYNVTANTLTFLPSNGITKFVPHISLVQIGKRIFIISAFPNVSLEFDYVNNVWLLVETPLLYPHYGQTGAVEVPANLFSSHPGSCQGIN